MDVIIEYSDDILKNKMEEVKKDLLESKEYKEYKRVWEKFKKVKVKDLTDDECELLMKKKISKILKTYHLLNFQMDFYYTGLLMICWDRIFLKMVGLLSQIFV